MPRGKGRSIYAREYSLTLKVAGKEETLRATSEEAVIQKFKGMFNLKDSDFGKKKPRKTHYSGYDWFDGKKFFCSAPTANEVDERLNAKFAELESEKHKNHVEYLKRREDYHKFFAPTFSEYAVKIITERKDRGLIRSQGVIDLYQGYIKNQFNLKTGDFTLGELKVIELTTDHIQKFLDMLAKTQYTNYSKQKSYSTQTIKLIRNLIRMICRYAVEDNILSQPIPFDSRMSRKGIEIGKVVHRLKNYLSKDDIQKLLDVAESPIDKAIMGLACLGLRMPSEGFVRWDNIRNGVLLVRSAVRREAHKLVEKELKTSESVREIPIPEALMPYIYATREMANETGNPYILCSDNKQKIADKMPLDPKTIQTHFKKLIVKANLPENHIYNMRGSIATLLSNSYSPSTLKSILGHSSIQTSLQFYVKSSEAQKAEALENLGFGVKKLVQ